MYFNNIHVLIYLCVGLLGCLVGQVLGLVNKRLENHEKIIEKGSLKKFKNEFEAHYLLMTVMFLSYVAILYVAGIDVENWYANIRTVSYFILYPMLVSAFLIDLKLQIIPNRLVLTIFEVGIIFTFIDGIFSPNGMTLVSDRIYGLFAGAGVFLVITLLGGLIAGKEAMGMGDVKLMGALGLFFGVKPILMIAVLSFLIGAVASIFLLATKIRKSDEYIPFGPFIVVATIAAMFIPESLLFSWLWYFFSAEWLMGIIRK